MLLNITMSHIINATNRIISGYAMIEASKAGFLFRTTEQIKKDYPQYPAYETFDELLSAIKANL